MSHKIRKAEAARKRKQFKSAKKEGEGYKTEADTRVILRMYTFTAQKNTNKKLC